MRLLCNPEEKNVGALLGVSEKTRSGLIPVRLSLPKTGLGISLPSGGDLKFFRFARSLSPSASFPFRRWVTVDFAFAGKLRVRRSLGL